jgi:hypothetical protein
VYSKYSNKFCDPNAVTAFLQPIANCNIDVEIIAVQCMKLTAINTVIDLIVRRLGHNESTINMEWRKQ